MVADARTRPPPARPLACAIALALSGCTNEPEQGERQPGNAEPAEASSSGAGAQTAPDGARRVEGIADDKLIEAILNECHRPLQKRMQQVKVTVTLPDKRRLLIQADLPNHARVAEGRRDFLVRDDQVHRLDKDAAGEVEPTTAADAGLMRRLVRIVDAASFGPLYRAASCARREDHFVLTDASGGQTQLRLHPNTLLPSSLTYGQHTVRFDDYLRTPTTWVVNRATLPPLGTCDVFFEDGGILIPQGFFDLAKQSAPEDPGERVRMTAPGSARERESTTPMLTTGRAAKWVMLAASPDWVERHEHYSKVHAELERQNQQIFGFPMLWQADGEARFAIPFRQRKDGPSLRARREWQIAGSDQTRLLVVYPATGSVEERIRAGTDSLRRALVNRKLKAIGPIIAQPFIHLHRGPPDAEKLKDCKVRVSVRVQ